MINVMVIDWCSFVVLLAAEISANRWPTSFSLYSLPIQLSSIQSFSSHVISHIFKITKSGNQKQSQFANLLAESFYYVKYGLSIITSKIPSKILSNENKKTGVSRKIVCFGILIHVLSWRQQKHQCLCFHYWDFLTNFWRNNWQSIIDVVKRLCFATKMSTTIVHPRCKIWVWQIFKNLITSRNLT